MRKPFTFFGVLTACLMIPAIAPAQEAPERHLSSWTRFEVEPPSVPGIVNVASQIAEAAKAANLATEYGWTFWNNVFSYVIVAPFHMEDLADPQAGLKRFQGTPGEATVTKALEEFQGVGIRSVTAELVEMVPEWIYLPPGMTEIPMEPTPYANVFDLYLKNGSEEQFNEIVEDVFALMKEVGYAYPILGHRILFGEGRASFVTLYDDPGTFHGAGSMDALIEKSGNMARWQEILARMSAVSIGAGTGVDWTFVPGMSYMGPGGGM